MMDAQVERKLPKERLIGYCLEQQLVPQNSYNSTIHQLLSLLPQLVQHEFFSKWNYNGNVGPA